MQCRLCWITVLSETAGKYHVEGGRKGSSPLTNMYTHKPSYAGGVRKDDIAIGLLVSYEPQTKYNHELCQRMLYHLI
jgi:hypothetical protein